MFRGDLLIFTVIGDIQASSILTRGLNTCQAAENGQLYFRLLQESAKRGRGHKPELGDPYQYLDPRINTWFLPRFLLDFFESPVKFGLYKPPDTASGSCCYNPTFS